MVDVTQYNFSYEEIVTALVRHLDLNEGLWTLNARFATEAKNLHTNGDNSKFSPGLMVVVQHLSLMKVAKSIPGLTVDAAKVNPKPYDGQTRK
jgi:hypothetical protein